jgi:hypothetical protein
MRDKISQGRAGVPDKEAENLALHVRQIVPTLAEYAILFRAEKMHDGVDGLEHVIGNFVGLFVDISNLCAIHVDIINYEILDHNA